MMDAVVIGAGPNGLTAAATLAKRGWSVAVFETQPRPGGALWSLESTLPGFLHDVGAAFFPFADDSPAFRHLNLTGAGLHWINAPRESCHPAPDGSCVTISRDIEQSRISFGADGEAWHRLARWMQAMGLLSSASFSTRHFRTEAARRVIPGLALHVDLGPDDLAGAGLGLVLGLLASHAGFRIPVGGARSISNALIYRLQQAGGQLYLGERVEQILVRNRQVVAIRTSKGNEVPVRKAVLADVTPAALFTGLLRDVPGLSWIRNRARRFRPGWGTFKMDWALNSPVPWSWPEARESAVLHAGDSLADLRAFTQEVRSGQLPSNPYLVIGQQSLFDPSRAPAGGQTLWAYSRVPSHLPEGWANHKESFADRIEQRIEALAPGFRERILARAIVSPEDLQNLDENLVGGDLGGGSALIDQQLFLRPVFPYFQYRMPVRRLYLCSASTHPGAGVHGACGFNAARMAMRDAGERPSF